MRLLRQRFESSIFNTVLREVRTASGVLSAIFPISSS
ncbi:hypothetical protein KP509_20G081900 [Ceratopteris richardii]|uniref:Uncharacterized protein n=1 Tax=Ceratopteris richardii TaxID=49495 RepID=A0A8T2SHH5_CERRI|nr:hypothetical protein KP509_20G081900 [Ceratopteris richardii]